jgi:hypothetical protein
MPPSDIDAIDFKPFFDAVIGVLFVLLILIAAQLFFTQWASVPEDNTQERSPPVFLEWERQVSAFLTDFAERLRGDDLTPAVDFVDKSVSLPLSQIARIGPDAWPQINQQPGSIGRLLLDRLHCLPRQAAAPSSGCPVLDLLRLGRVNVELRVGVPGSAELAADRYAEYLRILVSAALIQGAPGLLAVSGSGAAPAIASTSSVIAPEMPPPEKLLAGDVALRFTFEPPQPEPRQGR